ncbi:MAG TPA: GGDEF domain-containing protein [Acidimicrobiia bacterium]|nr:GGDEF domain-containing protein [Acidimicrobiia bacterium]
MVWLPLGLLGALALAALAAGAVLLLRLRTRDRDARGLHHEVHRLEEALLAEREAFESATMLADEVGSAGTAAAEALGSDSETGLLGEHYFQLAIEQRIAAARRQLQPVALLLLSLEGDGAGDAYRQQAAISFAGILRETLRESDTACRIGDNRFGVILEDTSEAGGVWAAERLRTALARKGDSLLRLAAGVAAYPTHALEGDEVLSRARRALDSARSSGSSRVEVASVD